MTLSYAERCLEREWHYKGNPPKSLEDIRRITQEERVLHESHYLLFWALDEIALSLAERARRLSTLNRSGLTDASRGPFQEALDAMTSTVRLLENMLPAVHHEKSVYYDRLGQLAVAAGNVELAGQSYARAYEMSKLACGAEVPNTLKLLKIAEKVPQNVEELLEHYADHSKDMEVEEDDDWIDG
jgi:SET and MYND domain-containing protein